MRTPEQTYKRLSDAVEAMRFGHDAATKRADAHVDGTPQERAASRSEYIRTLQLLQAEAQAVLDGTSDFDRNEMFATQFGARQLRHCI